MRVSNEFETHVARRRTLSPVKPQLEIAKLDQPTIGEIADGFFDVLHGRCDAVHGTKVVSEEECASLARAFENSPLRHARNDGVPGWQLGEGLYGSTPEKVKSASRKLYGQYDTLMPENGFLDRFITTISECAAEQGYTIRPAVIKGSPAFALRGVNWTENTSSTGYLLRLHDDVAQIKNPANRGFEGWKARRVIAINIYAKAEPDSGQLVVLGWRPTEEDRVRHSVKLTGYPYAPDAAPPTAGRHVFNLSTGDCVFIDGGLVHGCCATIWMRMAAAIRV